MLPDKAIEGFYDDGFKGSVNEHSIFTEVFSVNNQNRTSKKCLVTGAINFERDSRKPTDALLSHNDVNLTISSQSNVGNVNCLNYNSGLGFSQYGHALSTRDDNVANDKRIKLSLEGRLVESTSADIIASSYLLKKDVYMHNLQNIDEDDKPKNSAIDPRPILRKYVQDLLRAAGWEITIRHRADKANGNGGYLYKSPQTKRLVREFHKAWSLCGQSLSVDISQLVQEDAKHWKEMTSFWFDLSHTLSEIEKESVLAQKWCLLDPFVNLVFIEKRLGMLKAGEVVEARSSLVIDSHLNEIAAKNRNRSGTNSKKGSSRGICRSPFTGESELTNAGANDSVCLSSCGLEGNSDHSSSCLNEEMASVVDRTINFKTPQAESGNIQKNSVARQMQDEDLFISAMFKKKTSRYSSKKSTLKPKPCKTKSFRKCKTQKGSCRLLPKSLSKRGKHIQGKWFDSGPRTVLSWLINCGIVPLKKGIQLRNSMDNAIVKEGSITKHGILCKCCNKVISVSKFKSHAGSSLNHSCLNLVMDSGKAYTLCLLEAWSDEYRTRKSATRPIEVEDLDQNDDSCGLCGGGGELICCDNCPSTYHLKCFPEQEFPEGDWFCQYCTCRICGNLVDDKQNYISTGALKCLQCDHKYHDACLKEKVAALGVSSEGWFCGNCCQEVYFGLQAHVGVSNHLPDGFSWSLLRCIHEDQVVSYTEDNVALKAECNLKLAVALTIMEECFLSMVDARTGIDMIPHVIYNWGSEFARLNFHGFYTMVLEQDDVLISAASIRIHGVRVAEMPLIATCSKYRRQGMCRRLMSSIEEMLISLKVEMLVITAISNVVETWTDGFGFEALEDVERKNLSDINLMVFPGTVWLKKTMYKNKVTNEQMRSDGGLSFEEVTTETRNRDTEMVKCE